jgi:DNA-directed RNA polymerase subunit N (RpoN/RPB10)
MVEIGEPSEEVADNSGVERICWRRSGEAFRRNQRDGSEETATCA